MYSNPVIQNRVSSNAEVDLFGTLYYINDECLFTVSILGLHIVMHARNVFHCYRFYFIGKCVWYICIWFTFKFILQM